MYRRKTIDVNDESSYYRKPAAVDETVDNHNSSAISCQVDIAIGRSSRKANTESDTGKTWMMILASVTIIDADAATDDDDDDDNLLAVA